MWRQLHVAIGAEKAAGAHVVLYVNSMTSLRLFEYVVGLLRIIVDRFLALSNALT
jgi:hypothetical protein